MFLHLYPGSRSEREEVMRPFMSFMFDATGLRGDLRLGLFRDGVLAACALIDRPSPGFVRTSAGQVLTMLRFLPMTLGLSRAQIGFLNRYMLETRRAAPKSAHHYLAMIGVDPDFQGQGLGRQMLARIIDVAEHDPVSAGVALDTENEANRAFYHRLGFALREQIDIGPCQAVCMFRPEGAAR